MSSDDLQRQLRNAPFIPFRVHMGNNRTIDVRHPEMMIVADETVTVTDNGRTYIRWLALINIHEIEELAAQNN